MRHLDGERYRALAPDIRGHGAAATRRPIDFAACVQDAVGLTAGPFALAGYSQGARLALHVALAHPQLVTRLVLVSATAGIEDDAERARRRAADVALAAWMEADGRLMSEVADRWGAQPLFATQSPQVAAAARADRLANEPVHLAAALRGIGTGVMAPLWERLGELTMPVVVLAGELDEKYVALGERLAAALPRATLQIVAAAGHALPLEAPEAVAAAIDGRAGRGKDGLGCGRGGRPVRGS